MLRGILILFLAVSLFNQSINQWVIRLSYQISRAEYERNCENKQKPVLKCHGKCQLRKKLMAEEKKSSKNPVSKLPSQDEVISSKSFFCTYQLADTLPGSDHNLYAKQELPADLPFSIFHPPGY